MANTVLDTLTIDGVTMQTHDELAYEQYNPSINFAANTQTECARVTINELGLYEVYAVIRFMDADSTGARVCLLNVYDSHSGADLITSSQRASNQYGLYIPASRIILLDQPNQVPRDIVLRGYSSLACNANNARLVVRKIRDTHIA